MATVVDDVDTKSDESEDTVTVVSARVLMADYENEPPMFPDQEPDIPDVQNSTTTRKVFENSVSRYSGRRSYSLRWTKARTAARRRCSTL